MELLLIVCDRCKKGFIFGSKKTIPLSYSSPTKGKSRIDLCSNCLEDTLAFISSIDNKRIPSKLEIEQE